MKSKAIKVFAHNNLEGEIHKGAPQNCRKCKKYTYKLDFIFKKGKRAWEKYING